MVDKSDNLIIPANYDDIELHHSSGLFRVKQNSRWGLMNAVGLLIAPIEYDIIVHEGWQYGLFRVIRNGREGMMNLSGNLVVPVGFYDHVSGPSRYNGLIKVNRGAEYYDGRSYFLGGKFGMLDAFGNLVIPIQYDEIVTFNDELFKVNQGGDCNYVGKITGGSWGIMDKSGNLLVPVEYNEIEKLNDGFFKVNQGGRYDDDYGVRSFVGGKWGLVDTSGNLLVPVEYNRIYQLDDGLFGLKQDGKYGIMDTSGTLMVPVEYDWIYRLDNGLFKVNQGGCYDNNMRQFTGGKWGIVSLNGTIIPAIYNTITYHGPSSIRAEQYLTGGKVKAVTFDKTGSVLSFEIYDNIPF